MQNEPIVGVIDIGKSNAKFALVDLARRREIAVRKRPNAVVGTGPYPHYDIEGIWAFLIDAIAELNAEEPIDVLSVTTHGAGGALLDETGALALPVLDYEHEGPDALAAQYDAARPDFSESFTPRLPGGLNLGAQFFWQARAFPEAFARVRTILTYPQYWAHRLCGVAANEITSLGCHTDLWDFPGGGWSSLVRAEGWQDRLAPLRKASDRLGPVRPDLVRKLGLRRDVPVLAGIHDSNASLLPHLIGRTPPFSVVSTGTWVIVCTPGGPLDGLDPARDCLANCDAFGRAVPSARFMGGREFSLLIERQAAVPSTEAVGRVLETGAMLLPSVQQGSGPFPHRTPHWTIPEAEHDPEARFVIVSLYLALMTAECLALSGATGPSVVEGPFATNGLYLDMLSAVTGRPVEPMTASATGTSIGAAMLAELGTNGAGGRETPRAHVTRAEFAPLMARYGEAWRAALS
ncbi:carbohydrate kinase [Arsenicitalea aurantiaca]|uniref:Carbohydrate kinase n=1 Tax=Arsenicitalea aurantiaca TaxID=1783274 RepID=A0A433X8A6_9HYPH|nr:FGGY-family carbohydrate kinase [Arsenicitalea aurantiaca]RUT30327.1 carbohydrate kinase [Arsenicitalea aurantiaca]